MTVTIGQVYSVLSSIANDSYQTLQPTGTQELLIHNLYYDGAVEIYISDGTHRVKFDNDATYGARNGQYYKCTATIFIEVKNKSGSSMYIGADGYYTRV